VTYVVYTVRLTSASRADLVGFWRWVKARDAWFYKELPMVKSVRRYVTAVGDISTVEIWQEFEDLRAYVYRSAHAEVLRQRREWFEKFDRVFLALWWIPAGHIPSIDEAKARLASLEENGPTPLAFTFKTTFPPDSALELIA